MEETWKALIALSEHCYDQSGKSQDIGGEETPSNPGNMTQHI
jgi:hypothetical protein